MEQRNLKPQSARQRWEEMPKPLKMNLSLRFDTVGYPQLPKMITILDKNILNNIPKP